MRFTLKTLLAIIPPLNVHTDLFCWSIRLSCLFVYPSVLSFYLTVCLSLLLLGPSQAFLSHSISEMRHVAIFITRSRVCLLACTFHYAHALIFLLTRSLGCGKKAVYEWASCVVINKHIPQCVGPLVHNAFVKIAEISYFQQERTSFMHYCPCPTACH